MNPEAHPGESLSEGEMLLPLNFQSLIAAGGVKQAGGRTPRAPMGFAKEGLGRRAGQRRAGTNRASHPEMG